MSFQLPSLTYNFEALEPHIDSKTMQIHHGKHHAGYTNKLNAALAGTDMEGKTIEDVLKNLDMNNSAVRNNGGGYFNHCLFWEIMGPSCGGNPKGTLANSIDKSFGSFDEFKSKFSKAAATRFGSGWAWLCVDSEGGLEVCSTANQDNPLMPGECGKTPILGLDVWEHAYYLNYQNRRPDYIEAFFSVVNWDAVSEKYNKSKEL
jgi:Fe-Mn family superoxide dismutase|tara:strand:- start:3938 stop:4549 length:612 start_codon:yes stop_codon:yes gene_type:complete